MYTIILQNETKLEKLTLNGNNFISPKLIDDSVFDDNLGTVTIINHEEGKTETHNDMVLVQNVSYDGKTSWFILAAVVIPSDETADPPESYLMERIITLENEVKELRVALEEKGK